MSEANSSGSAAAPLSPAATGGPADGGVRGAVARAAQATGVDFSYLLAQARLESSLDPKARATTSSAAGLYQFTRGTWGSMLARHGTALGLDAAAQAGASAGAAPASRAQLMALRYDPDAAAMMAAELAGDNAAALTAALGRAPTASELYLAHFLGPAGATRFLDALATDPGRSAAALLPRAAAANRAVFFDAAGQPRSVGAMMNLIQTRMDTAMQDATVPEPAAETMPSDPGGLGAPALVPLEQGDVDRGPMAREFAATRAADPASGGAGQRSMSDTLRSTFGLAGESAAPGMVRSAYGRLQALGL